MGFLQYGQLRIDFDDRILTHLEVVVLSKFRRHESFAMTWRETTGTGESCSTLWLSPSQPVYFHFEESRYPNLDRRWAERLAVSAAGPAGLVIVDENGSPIAGSTRHLRA